MRLVSLLNVIYSQDLASGYPCEFVRFALLSRVHLSIGVVMKLRQMRASVLMGILVFLACCAGITGARAHTASFTLPFELIDNRVFVNVQLNGRGPYHFILDTGASGAISDRTAHELGLKVEDGGVGPGTGEKKVQFGLTNIAQVQLGPLSLSNVAFSVISFADSDQVFGTKPLDGVIGKEVFEKMVVKFDYIHHQLAFTDPGDFDPAGQGVQVEFKRPIQIPVVQAVLDGIPGRFGVDTGARTSMVLYTAFCAQNRLQQKYGAHLEGVTGWGIGGPVHSLLARARELSIGDIQVSDLVIRLSTQKSGLTTSSDMAGLIGPDVLSQFDVTFDYSRSRMFFAKNAEYGRRDTYDRAGLWMGQDGSNFTAVDVIAGSPAQQAGVHQGDTILAIDGVDTAHLVLPDVRQSMHQRPTGSKVALLLDSKGKRWTAIVTLRDLV